MAKIKFGQIISEARGKIAGMVFSKNRSCSFIRTKATPIQPHTAFQVALRNNLTATAKAWQTFSDNVRNEFAAHASEGDRQNSIGDKVRLSAFNFYIGLCRNAFTIGKASPTSYPGANEPFIITSFSGIITHAPNKIELTFTPAIPLGHMVAIYATPPCSQGAKCNLSLLRRIDQLDETNLSPWDATAIYIYRFGGIPWVGQQCYFQIVSFNTTSMKRSLPTTILIK